MAMPHEGAVSSPASFASCVRWCRCRALRRCIACSEWTTHPACLDCSQALVEGREETAVGLWRSLRGSQQCVLDAGYEQGWDTKVVKAGPSSPSK